MALPADGDRSAGWLIARALVLGLLVVASYLPALEAGFVWDDTIFADEPVVHAWSGLWNIWFSPADIKKEGHYWPVVYTSFWLEHKLWGVNPLGYHAVNLLLHIANVLLIWRILRRLAVPGAWVIAAVFAVHPLHVESVAWVIERKDLLSALFYLTAALTWIRYVEAPKPARYLLVLGLFTAGLLSKSIVVTLPVSLLIWHWWRSGRVTRTDLLRVAPLFALAAAITALDLSFYTSREPLALGYSFIDRILIAARALWFYVGKLLWPTGLAIVYPLWEIDPVDPVAWIYVLAAAALPALLWIGRDRLGRGPLAGVLFYAVTLSPVLGFVDYGYMQFSLVADRFQYLAGLGVLAVLLGAATFAVSRLPSALRTGAGGALVVTLAVLGTLTWRQTGIYRDPVAFFSHIVALNPEARDAHLNLMGPLSDAGHHEEALAAGRIGVAQRPGNADIHSNLGRVLTRLDRLDEAESALRTALGIEPRHLNANQNLGEVLRRQGRHAEAIETYHRVLEIDDRLVYGNGGLGIALFHSGRYAEAIAPLEKALELAPDAHFTGELAMYAGRAAFRLDRLDAASAHLRRAAASMPDPADALVELSNVRFAQGRADEALDHLRRARELRPNDPATLVNAGEALRKGERSTEAIALYRKALRIDADFVPAQVGLGAALFNLERYDEALESLTRAIQQEMDPGTAATAHYLSARTLLELDRKDEAAAQFEHALKRDQNHAKTLDYLAHLRFGQKKYEAALDLYRTQATLKPGSATVHANIGVTLYFLGRHAEALESMEQVLRLDPDHQMARKMVAQLRKGNR
ncbi:MAG: tetratricopeptide repeat protein [Candidatus Aminicenantes bacterium]|nr:tetratricopeptide repeat protein [Candidatus Aminicenantes bacterium]